MSNLVCPFLPLCVSLSINLGTKKTISLIYICCSFSCKQENGENTSYKKRVWDWARQTPARNLETPFSPSLQTLTTYHLYGRHEVLTQYWGYAVLGAWNTLEKFVVWWVNQMWEKYQLERYKRCPVKGNDDKILWIYQRRKWLKMSGFH